MITKNTFDLGELAAHGLPRIGELNPYITLACDLRCGYCYMLPLLQGARNVTEVMPREFLDRLIDSVIGDGKGLDRMTFLGGEPTLHPEITAMVNDAAAKPITELRMTTNATSLHHLQLDQLRPGAFDHVSVSIDGITAATNDPTRGCGTFDHITATLAEYAAAGIRLSVNYTVTTINIATLPDVPAFFHDLGVSVVNIHRASLSGGAHQRPELIVRAPEWVAARDRLLAQVTRNRHQYAGMTFRIPWIFLQPHQFQSLGYTPIQVNNYHCPTGGHRLIVLPPTPIGQGRCYMSADLIGENGAELGRLDCTGWFRWNSDPRNEFAMFAAHSDAPNISTIITGQQSFEEDPTSELVRVSHSFKTTIHC